MRSAAQLSTGQIQSIFGDEISAGGGTVRDALDDGERFFARSVFASPVEILTGDRVQGGVAIRAVDDLIDVHPYTFRLVCSNGAIMARAIEAREIDAGEFLEPYQTESALREAIRLCGSPEAFASAGNQMRAAATAEIDLMLMIAPMLSRAPAETQRRLISNIVQRVGAGRRGTRYDLMNVVTATARDTRDPEARWRLEELGGAIAAGMIPMPKPTPSRRARVRAAELVGLQTASG